MRGFAAGGSLEPALAGSGELRDDAVVFTPPGGEGFATIVATYFDGSEMHHAE